MHWASWAIAGVAHAQKNQFPWDDYRVEGDVTTIHVQGNVYMLHGLGGNVAVQIGDDGRFTGKYRAAAKLRQANRRDS